MWEWNSEVFRTRRLEDAPAVAAFAAGLVVEGPGGLDVNRSVLSRYGMHALPLIEWDHSHDAPAFFEALRHAGSTRGFFLDYPSDGPADGSFRECNLTPAAAAIIAKECLFGQAMLFVDDQFLAVVAAWNTDFTYLCMAPSLFDRYLSDNPMLLALSGDDHERPADTFRAALLGSFRRLEAWSPRTSPVRAELDWQLVAPQN
ncbi:hypothetical protein [Sphingomonas kyeonggiensis]|uniref:Uncharacterized protein n=1 Tax=Sphingomonas kyeonggiensis TaxID=1268553 RepID=A0A7W6JUQ1_9SPHN|nr:hypothetical protein [Sphingomonas kyeonggiensis]MBB4099903.1 hypothetical protein [Sphingomonas kyeonggiensis]